MKLVPFVIFDNQDITRVGLRGYISLLYAAAKVSEVHDKKSLYGQLSVDEPAVVVLDYSLSDYKSVDELLVAAKRFATVHWILFSNELSERAIRQVSGEENISIVLKESGEEKSPRR